MSPEPRAGPGRGPAAWRGNTRGCRRNNPPCASARSSWAAEGRRAVPAGHTRQLNRSALDRLEPGHRPPERAAERLAFWVGERRFARLADRLGLLERLRGRRVVHQRIEDREEIRAAAAVGFAVALEQRRAGGDFQGE